MKIALAQLNPIISDFEGNLQKAEKAVRQVYSASPDLILFSELYLSGYPPQDLLEKKAFILAYENAVKNLIQISKIFPNTGILCGIVQPHKNAVGKGLYNSAILIENGKILFQQHKSLLPTYDVFDETRYFYPVSEIDVFSYRGECLGITICEDAWNDPELFPQQLYNINPIEILVQKGAAILINISASPFGIGKENLRYQLFQTHARKHQKPFILLNRVGANDELISDGNSMVLNAKGELIHKCPAFMESVDMIDLKNQKTVVGWKPQEDIESVFHALCIGIRDYMKKCVFEKVVLGLSGGIDSAVTCCLASRAIGSQNVLGVSMPSPYSSKGSVADAKQLAENLGIKFKLIPISSVYQAYLDEMRKHYDDVGQEDVTEENIQARIRGNILMALSNKEGYLTLSSGNKSELSVGYCTLYGDMIGGLSVLSDVPKTMVYQLADYINRVSLVIPKAVLEKPPSAELKSNQTDQDTLPPYDILDAIMERYIDLGQTREEIIQEGFNEGTVNWIIDNINKHEYKRRQAAPGLKITSKAFGSGRRMPIAAKYNF